MNFDTSEEQELLQETLAQLVENECPAPRVREVFDGDTGHDPALWKSLMEMGMGGLAVPEAYGGAGLELIDLALATETLAYGGAPGPFFGHALAGLALVLGGSDAQKEKWLPRLASGEILGTVALSEGSGRWQPEQWEIAGGDSLTGTKHFVPSAESAELIVVGVAGGALALVEAGSAVKAVPFEGVDRARRMGTLEFAGAPAEQLPGADVGTRLRDAGCILLAADAFGAATRLIDMAVEHAKTREQFGVTIGHFQALKHQLADMAVDIEPARGLYWYAAHAFDHIPEDAARYAALAKSHIPERGMQVARDVVEAHGGIGITWECDVQIWFKRMMLDRAWLGTPAVHRERAADLAGW